MSSQQHQLLQRFEEITVCEVVVLNIHVAFRIYFPWNDSN
jgi:hypothetical protein